MSSTIIEILGFYMISSIGIYKYLLNMPNNEDITLIDYLIVIISFVYCPLMLLYDGFRILKFKHKRRKQISKLIKEINDINKMIVKETDEEVLEYLKKEKSEKEDLLYICTNLL